VHEDYETDQNADALVSTLTLRRSVKRVSFANELNHVRVFGDSPNGNSPNAPEPFQDGVMEGDRSEMDTGTDLPSSADATSENGDPHETFQDSSHEGFTFEQSVAMDVSESSGGRNKMNVTSVDDGE
jgi:hypothetical protein